MAAQPIQAATETAPRDGLFGAVGYGLRLIESRVVTEVDEATGIPAQRTVVVVDGDLTSITAPGSPSPDPFDPQGRWAGPFGYTLQGDPCGDTSYTRGLDFCAEPPFDDSADGASLYGVLEDQRPFLVGAAVNCSVFGSQLDDVLGQFEPVADRALDLRLWANIENELWTGQRAAVSGWANRHLASPDASVLNEGAAVPLVEAVAALEDAFALCSPGAVQVIHAPRKFAAYMDWKKIIHTTPGSGRLWTANDSLVVAGRGYPGTGPDSDEPTDTTAWMYSTGILTARLGAVEHPNRDLGWAVTAESNDVKVRAEREVAIAWLCCHLAVNVEYGA